MNYSEAVQFIQSFPDSERDTHGSRGLTMSLDTMRALLKRLGDPHVGRHTIHVTGSKGKGSTCTMLASIMNKAGIRTAAFTSPHLHSYTERITVDLKPITEEEFVQGLVEIKPAIEAEVNAESGYLSTFGILTALFFHITKNLQPAVDWQIVEVGLGGRYDATNVFETKDLAIVTPISLEHVEVLGASQTEIATNKGGIITAGCTAILAPQKDASVRSVIGRQCHMVGADLVDVGSRPFKLKLLSHDLNGQTFTLESPLGNLDLKVSLLGTHQVTNAATAAIAAKVLAQSGEKITDANIVDGLADANIYGRFEVIPGGDSGTHTPTVILDGAHNNESAAALALTLKTLFKSNKCIFIVGVNNDKNINAIWRELHPISKTVISTRSQSLRAMDPQSLADAVSFQSAPLSASTESVPEAIELAFKGAEEDDIVVITGSLYVVAEAREYLLAHGRVPMARPAG
jgi:dihydrofolate synthase / folylpolyglutamate synthase